MNAWARRLAPLPTVPCRHATTHPVLKELANSGLRFCDFPVLSYAGPPCSTGGASGGVRLAEPRCGARVAVSQTARRVVSDHRPHPSLDGGCLRWLDVDRMKGGAGARLDRGEVKARPSGPRKSGPRGEMPRWSAGRRACRSHGTRAPSQGAQVTRAIRRSAPSRGPNDPSPARGQTRSS